MTSLEKRLNTLEELTKKLENGNLSIDEAISVYSQGMELAVDCKKSLDNLTQKVETAKKNAQEALSENDKKAHIIRSDVDEDSNSLPF